MTEVSGHMSFAEVSTVLWRQRQLLELLEVKLDEQHHLLRRGRERLLALLVAELERVHDELLYVELFRAIEVDALAESLGLAPNPSLADLAAASPSPWSSIFDEHRVALSALVEDVHVAAAPRRFSSRRAHNEVCAP